MSDNQKNNNSSLKKKIDKKSMKASRMTQRVEHEVKIHYQLKHPSILEVNFKRQHLLFFLNINK